MTSHLYRCLYKQGQLGGTVIDTLSTAVEGHKTQQIEEFDAILHYIKMASTLKMTNINDNADSNPGSEDKNIPTQVPSQGPSWVNYPSTSKNNPYNT